MDEKEKIDHQTKLDILNKKENERKERVLREYLNSKEYQERLLLRAKLFDATKDGRRDFLLSRVRIYELCKGIQEDGSYDPAAGCIFFINNFGWTYAPKLIVNNKSSKHLPFILFEFQENAIRWFIDRIEKGEDAFAEKSRDMGASWIFFVYISLWYWLFRDGTNILMGSYKEMLVDDKTIDSLFGKLDYALDGLPKWMMPKGYNRNKHRTKLKLVRPDNGNVITGDTMNPNFGRGSRKTAILFDELGFWDYAKDAWEGCADSTNCRLANSTPNGYNYYAMLREMPISIHTMHWREHPLKDDEWYSYEKMTRTPESLAQEVDISYSKSLEGKVYPDWNEVNVEQGVFEYDPLLPLYVGWDFGKTDDTAIIWCQPNRGKLRIIDTYRNAAKTIDFYIPFINGYVSSEHHNYTPKDLEKIDRHKYWKKGTHFGDPAGRFQNNVVDLTVVDVLRESGIIINFQDNWKHFKARKEATRHLILNGIELNMNSDTKWFNTCMSQAAYPKVKREGVDFTNSEKPKHDFTSHYRSAFEYLALGLRNFGKRRVEPVDKFKKGRFNKKRVIGY